MGGLDKPLLVGDSGGDSNYSRVGSSGKKGGKKGGVYEAPEGPKPTEKDLEGGGLTEAEARQRQETWGPNAIDDKPKTWLHHLLPFIVGPMPYMLEIAVIVTLATKDWLDAGVLIFLIFLNAGLGYMESKNAGSAIDALKKTLAPTARVKRDGQWRVLAARELVVGDLIHIKLGDIIAADSVLVHGSHLEIDQAALTGESLPVTKWKNDTVYASSIVKRGEMECVVSAIGRYTFFGKAATLVDSVEETGNIHKVLNKMMWGLLIVSLIAIAVIMGVMFTRQYLKINWNVAAFGKDPNAGVFYFATSGPDSLVSKCAGGHSENAGQVIKLCLVLLIASIPIATPLVVTATLAVGARRLARANAIVTCLSAIEELAGMDILCSDKTGTLTKNQLTLNDPWVFDNFTSDDVIFYAALAAKKEGADAIDSCILAACPNKPFFEKHVQVNFEPFDPVSKRTLARVRAPDGSEFEVAKGAPQVLLALGTYDAEMGRKVQHAMEQFAGRGLRPVGVSCKPANGQWQYVGVVSLFDPPRDDTAKTIETAIRMGADVKMITGDHLLIAKETARRIGMGTNILGPDFFEQVKNKPVSWVTEAVENADGFAQVFPEHKYMIVEAYKTAGHCTAMTGDGVNDAPALKVADVGIAVEGATDAARASADIVLLSPGLSTIITAMIRSRKIFQRIKNYFIYRVSASTQVLLFVFIAILGLQGPSPCYDTAGNLFPIDLTPAYATEYQNLMCNPAFVANQTTIPSTCFNLVKGVCTFTPSAQCASYANDWSHYQQALQCSFLPQCGWTCDEQAHHVCSLEAGVCRPCVDTTFRIPAIVLMLIVILNDGTICAIAYDKVIPGPTPDRWSMWENSLVGIINGMCGFAHTFVVFWLSANDMFFFSKGLTTEQIKTLIYFSLSLSGQVSVFVCRTRGFFFERRPGYVLLSCVSFASVVSLALSLTWFLGAGMWKVKFIDCVAIFVLVVIYFFISDIVKVIVYRSLIPAIKRTGMDYRREKAIAFRKAQLQLNLKRSAVTF